MMYYYKTNGGLIAVTSRIDGEEITAEEFAALKARIKIPVWTDAMQEHHECHRPLTESEVMGMLLRQQVNTLEVDDQTAFRMREFYPEWADIFGQTAEKAGYKFTYNGDLYKTIPENHTFAAQWVPGDGTESLYTRIDETHDGSRYDPIPYHGNMALVAGLYYIQDGVPYLCNRDTGNPVYHALSEMVGIYVEVING